MLAVAVWLVVAVHFAVCFFVSLGTFAVMRWPKLVWVHVPWVLWMIFNATSS